MAIVSGTWLNLKKTGKGSDYVVLTGAMIDEIIERINLLGSVQINPKANVATWCYGKDGPLLDLSSTDQRLQALEGAVGIGGAGGGSNTSITLQITNINNRLNAASATANCVANAVVVAITI